MIACQIAWTLFRTPHQDRAHPLRRLLRPPGAVRRERDPGGPRDQPGAARHRLRRAADPLPGRAAGARFRGRPRAARRHARAEGRHARRPPAAGAARPHSQHRGRASRRSTAAAAASIPRATPSIEEHDEVFFLAAREDMQLVMSEISLRGSQRAARRDRRRRQHRLPPRAGARGAHPGQAHRARSRQRRAARRRDSCATRSC